MKLNNFLASATLATVGCLSLPTVAAHAEVAFFAPHEQKITTADGWDLVLRLDNESWNRVDTLNMTGTSREGFGDLRATVTVGGKGSSLKGAQVQVGYIIGCFADLNSITTGSSASLSPRVGIEPGFPLPLVPRGDLGGSLGPTVSVGISPGQIKAYPLAQKNLEATDGVLQLRQTHMNIDGCLGPTQVQAFASVTIVSKEASDTVSVYGDRFPI
ncbi:MspA family porin (plasmid) [Nocardia sp. CA-084685]|uniref:MspA family porin n=1 Tax=Nocardia sp. CA-084685 TaxID=3239970 RepID=UPI003D99FFCE